MRPLLAAPALHRPGGLVSSPFPRAVHDGGPFLPGPASRLGNRAALTSTGAARKLAALNCPWSFVVIGKEDSAETLLRTTRRDRAWGSARHAVPSFGL
jgi:hypothetical protein